MHGEALGFVTMARARVELFLASFLMLFVELVLIRWAGAYVVYLSYFANFILLGSFLGIGIGFLRAKRGPDLFRWAPIVLALFMGLVIGFPAIIDRTGGDLVYFGVQTHGLPVWLMLPLVFIATAITMATVAHGVAVRFAKFRHLRHTASTSLDRLRESLRSRVWRSPGWVLSRGVS